MYTECDAKYGIRISENRSHTLYTVDFPCSSISEYYKNFAHGQNVRHVATHTSNIYQDKIFHFYSYAIYS